MNEDTQRAVENLLTIANNIPSYASFADIKDFGEMCNQIEKAQKAVAKLAEWIRANAK